MMPPAPPFGVTRTLANSGLAVFPPQVPAADRAFYLERGRQVHAATELIDAGRLDWARLDRRLLPYCRAYAAALDDLRPTFVASELSLEDPVRQVRGRLDRLWHVAGSEVLVDLKCGSGGYTVLTPAGERLRRYAPPATGPQLAAYATLLAVPVQRAALILLSSGRYRWSLYDDPDDFTAWEASLSLAIYRWRSGIPVPNNPQEDFDDDH